MPDKIGKPLEKSPEEKAQDQKLIDELSKEPDLIEHVETPEYTDYNPLAAQADRLPAGIKGADGFNPNAHVREDSGINAEPTAKSEDRIDEDLGGGIGDASQLTAD